MSKSESSLLKYWSAQGHTQTKISNKLSPEKTEKLVEVYSNSKMAATVSDADVLQMLAAQRGRCARPGLVLSD